MSLGFSLCDSTHPTSSWCGERNRRAVASAVELALHQLPSWQVRPSTSYSDEARWEPSSQPQVSAPNRLSLKRSVAAFTLCTGSNPLPSHFQVFWMLAQAKGTLLRWENAESPDGRKTTFLLKESKNIQAHRAGKTGGRSIMNSNHHPII